MYDGRPAVLSAGARAARGLCPLRGNGAGQRDRAERGASPLRAIERLARSGARAGSRRHQRARSPAGLPMPVPAVVDCDRVGRLPVGHHPRRAGPACREPCRRDGGRGRGQLEPRAGAGRTAWSSLLNDAESRADLRRRRLGRSTPAENASRRSARSRRSSCRSPAADHFLGLLAVSVMQRSPSAWNPTSDLLDRLSGVAAQAATALQNGRLVDEITHRAMHDPLTGLGEPRAVHRGTTQGDPPRPAALGAR